MTLPTGMAAGGLLGLAVLVARGTPSLELLRLSRLTRTGGGSEDRFAQGRARRLPEVLAGGAWLVAGEPVLALLTVGLVVGGRRLRRRRAVTTSAVLERARAVEALASLAVELRAGRPPDVALAAATEVATGPFRQALQAGRSAARVGIDVPTALLSVMGEGHPQEGGTAVPEAVRGLAACWEVCSSTGSSLAPAVERLADGLRDRQAQQQAVASELAGPQATAGVLALLPLGGVALAASLGADPLHVLLRTPLGLGCLALGLSLDGLGLWWTARLVSRAGAS